jgi:hypothetical protein
MKSCNIYKKVFVSGGAGFIGSHLIRRLLSARETESVVVYDNFSSGKIDYLHDLIPDDRLKIIEAAWFVWALRDVVAASGNAHDGAEAMKYYATIAREINAVCDHGDLPSIGKLSGFTPIIGFEDIPKIINNFIKAWYSLITFKDSNFQTFPSNGNLGNMNLFIDITREQIISEDGHFGKFLRQNEMDQLKYAIWMWIGHVYKILSPLLGILALVVFLINNFYAIVRWQWGFLTTLGLGLFWGVSSLLGILSVIGMSLEEHYGFNPSDVEPIFSTAGFTLKEHYKFQLGLNNIYIFEK